MRLLFVMYMLISSKVGWGLNVFDWLLFSLIVIHILMEMKAEHDLNQMTEAMQTVNENMAAEQQKQIQQAQADANKAQEEDPFHNIS